MPDLVFQQTKLFVIHKDRQVWLRATDLARALGYAEERYVSRLYRRNADEFTDSMTRLVQLPTAVGFGVQNGPQTSGPLGGNPTPKTRVFSLRGCHLIAMLARTPVAKEFRRWILDLLDAISDHGCDDQRMHCFFGWSANYRRFVYEAGRAHGQMSHLKPERQKLILDVCDLLEKRNMSHKVIAEAMGISRHAVSYIGRRYYRRMMLFNRRRKLIAARINALLAEAAILEPSHD